MPRFGYRILHSKWFEDQCLKNFHEVDVDHSGSLDEKELYIALLRLYDTLNAALPCHLTIPDSSDVAAMMAECEWAHERVQSISSEIPIHIFSWTG
jgi:hypothetical protein